MGTGISGWLLRRERLRRGIPPLRISREEAIESASRAWGSEPENGTFMNKARVEESLEGWTVWMTAGLKPNRYVEVDGQTGKASGIWLEKTGPSHRY